jgi:hypothetical protein
MTACPKTEIAASAVDSGPAVMEVVDAGPVVTEERVDRWVAWHKAIAAIAVTGADGGRDLRRLAREEARLLKESGLTSDDADTIEAVVAAVVAERSVAKLTGADALAQFRAGLAQLGPEQRLKAEAAIAELQAQAPAAAARSMAPLEAQFGVDAVHAVLAREAEVTRTWDALLEARGDKR